MIERDSATQSTDAAEGLAGHLRAHKIVVPEDLEIALFDQQLHGGALDTVLLESQVVDDDALLAAMAGAAGTATVAARDLDALAPALAELIPEPIATATPCAPWRAEGSTLHVLVARPLSASALDALARDVGRSIALHVIPEVHLHRALMSIYGIAPPARLALLVAAPGLANAPAPPPARGELSLEAARAALVEADSVGAVCAAVCDAAAAHVPFAAVVTVRGRARRAVVYRGAASGSASGAARGAAALPVPGDSMLAAAIAGAPQTGRPPLCAGNALVFGWLGRRRPKVHVALPLTAGARVVAVLVADNGQEPVSDAALSALRALVTDAGNALSRLASGDSARERRAAALQPAALQPAALQPAAAQPAAPQPAAPQPAELEAPPVPPSQAAEAAQPAEADEVPNPAAAPAASLSPPLVAQPVAAPSDTKAVPAPPPLALPPDLARPSLRARTGADGDVVSPFAPALRPLPPAPAAEPRPAAGDPPRVFRLPPFGLPQEREPVGASLEELVADDPTADHGMGAGFAARGLERAIGADGQRPFATDDTAAKGAWTGALTETVARGLQGGTVPAEVKTRLFLDDTGWDDVHVDPAWAREIKDGSAPARAVQPSASATLPALVEAAAVSAAAGPPLAAPAASVSPAQDTLAQWIEELQSTDDVVSARAHAALIARGASVVPLLAPVFPGRLRVDPFAPSENVRSAEQLGPLVEVLHAFGAAGLDAAVPHLDARFPAHRFAAVLLFALHPDPRGVELLKARLHDQEPRIRELATDALMPFVADATFASVLSHLRERLTSAQPDARRRAVELLGTFRDVGATPALITALGAEPAFGEDIRKALRRITLVDHGLRAKAWERWWQKAKKRSRIEWLIDALASDDRELRALSHLELTAVAGDDFGYHVDGDRRARDVAAARFALWWSGVRAGVRTVPGPSPTAPTASPR